MCVKGKGERCGGYLHNTDWHLTLGVVVAEGLHCARAGCGFTHGWRVRKHGLCPAAELPHLSVGGEKAGGCVREARGVEGQFSQLHRGDV